MTFEEIGNGEGYEGEPGVEGEDLRDDVTAEEHFATGAEDDPYVDDDLDVGAAGSPPEAEVVGKLDDPGFDTWLGDALSDPADAPNVSEVVEDVLRRRAKGP
jgi:hypothetical protein